MHVVPTRYASRGEAVGPVEGNPSRELRVEGGIVGEPCTVKVLHRGQNAIHARWSASGTPSALRRDPPCPHARQVGGACGGCPWLHLTPDGARDARREVVREALRAVGLDIPVAPTVAGPEDAEGWRHVVKLVGWTDRRGRTRLGAFAPRSHDGVEIAGCMALAPRLHAFTRLGALEVPAGVVRAVIARASRSTRRVLATLVARADTAAVRAFARALPADGVYLHLHARDGDALTDPVGPLVHLRGDRTLEEAVGERSLALGPLDFFQTNPGLAQRLWASLPRPAPGTDGVVRLVDLYAGAGAVSLALLGAAARGAEVLLVEENAGAVARGAATLRAAGAHVEAVGGRVGGATLPDRFRGALVVANPPRSGFEPGVVARLAALAPSALALVSCHPDALARDLAALVAAGFSVERVTPFDMFPGTPHVEVVAVLG